MNKFCPYCHKIILVIDFPLDNKNFDSKNCIIDYYRIYPEKVTEAVKVYFTENKLKLKAN